MTDACRQSIYSYAKGIAGAGAVTLVALLPVAALGAAAADGLSSGAVARAEFRFEGEFLGIPSDWVDAQAQGLNPFGADNRFSRLVPVGANASTFAVPKLEVVHTLEGGKYFVGLSSDLLEAANLVVLDSEGKVVLASHVALEDVTQVRRYRESEFPISHGHFAWYDSANPVISATSGRGRLRLLTLRLDDGTPFIVDVDHWRKRSARMRAVFGAVFEASAFSCGSGTERRMLFDRSASRWCEQEGVREGPYERWRAAPTPVRIALGGYLRGTRTGPWTEWRAEPERPSVEFVACFNRGLADGYALVFDSKFQLRSVESFQSGKLYGPALSAPQGAEGARIELNLNGRLLDSAAPLDEYQAVACRAN